MKTASKQPWADATAPPKRPPKRAGEYKLCPRCKDNWMRCTSEYCRTCSTKVRRVRSHIKSVVRNLVLNKGRVRFEFRDGPVGDSDDDDGLYRTVSVEWTCRQLVCKPGVVGRQPCGEVFVTDEYPDSWVLQDAEAMCPSCGSTLKLKECETRLLDIGGGG